MGMKCTRPSKWKELLLLVCVFLVTSCRFLHTVCYMSICVWWVQKKSAVSSSHSETARCGIACFDRTSSRASVLLMSHQHPVVKIYALDWLTDCHFGVSFHSCILSECFVIIEWMFMSAVVKVQAPPSPMGQVDTSWLYCSLGGGGWRLQNLFIFTPSFCCLFAGGSSGAADQTQSCLRPRRQMTVSLEFSLYQSAVGVHISSVKSYSVV